MFVCGNCDAQSAKWAGRCTECGSWGSLTDAGSGKVSKAAVAGSSSGVRGKASTTVALKEATSTVVERLPLASAELSRVFGGGVVPGSVILLAGEPGIGKSTLVLALARDFGKRGTVLYVSGEESAEQIAGRAQRMKITGDGIVVSNDCVAENIVATVEALKPALVIVDSIQTCRLLAADGEPGTPTQIRGSSAVLTEASKRLRIPFILIGQVTKEGGVAGPKMLEHLVDVVLNLEGDSNGSLRLLRAAKNRFGSTNEVGILAMTEAGFADVANPSALLLKERVKGSPGSVVTAIIEGSRPLFLEIQALVSHTPFQFPVRKTSGIDPSRLHMIIAVLGKRAGVNLQYDDVHVNVVGGMTVKDPGVDLAVALAIVSSKLDIALPAEAVAVGELGLAGEIRSAPYLERRSKEAKKLGFTRFVAPSEQLKNIAAVLASLGLKA